MPITTVSTDLGGGTDELVIVLTGDPQRLSDAAAAIAALLRNERARLELTPAPAPCAGCGDA